MATHDYVIANGTGAAVRSDLNGALAAIVSNNSSATEPATMYAYQWWPDTTTGLLKQRNAANSAWITIGTLASANLGLLSLAGGTMTGALAVTAGTAALPGIAVSGDSNTGIYSPGADQLAVATNGTGRVFVDASGNVGIGGTPANYTGYPNIRINGTSGGILDLSTNGTSVFRLTGDTTGAFYYTQNASYPHVWGAGASERMRLNSSGQLGIGTSSPTNTAGFNQQLQLSGNLPCISIDNTGTGANKYSLGVNGVGALGVWDNTASAFRMYIHSSGYVGIGTTNPAYQLQVSTDSAGKPSTNTWTIVSDERIKEEIELADLDLCYQAVKNIPLKRFKWKDEVYTEEQVRDRRKLGWIAQDVEAVFPKAVGTYEFKYNQVFEETIIPAVEEVLDDDGNVITPAQPERIEKGELISEDVIEDCRDLNSDQLYAAMYGAIQKLMVKVETLEASNADLLARLSALEGA